MNCPKCKNPIADNAAVCEWCGENFVPQQGTMEFKKNYNLSISVLTHFSLKQPIYSITIDNQFVHEIKGGETKGVPIARGNHIIEIKLRSRKTVFEIQIEKDSRIGMKLNPFTGRIDVAVCFAKYFIQYSNNDFNFV
jgi:hypothetical protein